MSTIDDRIAQVIKDQEVLASLAGQMVGDLTHKNNVLHAQCTALQAEIEKLRAELKALNAKNEDLQACHQALVAEKEALRTWTNDVFGVLTNLNRYAEL